MGWFKTLLFGPGPGQEITAVRLAKGRGYTTEIVGEASYQHNIAKVAGPKTENGCKIEIDAELIFETANKYDANAVGVLIGGRLAGYIPREQATQFRAEILLVSPSEAPVICAAKIVGGWRSDDGHEGHYGVKLSLARPIRQE